MEPPVRRTSPLLATLLLTAALPACGTIDGARDRFSRGDAAGEAREGSADDAARAVARPGRDRLPEDEIVYFMLPDRFDNGDPSNDQGGLTGGPLETGFDPTHKGFYHGGDLAGLTRRLGYIQNLGATAIWLGPIYENKPVQGGPGQESAGYHGYWITDFTDVDPHLGTKDELRALADAIHARGQKLYLDTIPNHSADVIQFRECHDPDGPMIPCEYRRAGAYPYTTRGGPDGEAINEGFVWDGADSSGWENLTEADWAYTPYVPEAERDAKTPAWLNDPIYYHNRGDTAFRGESSQGGDFVGLDDIFTEHPRVLEGMIEIYGDWIAEVQADGFRVDTARHVNPEFWQEWVPAMMARAEAEGRPTFTIFGEVFDPDPAALARHSHEDGFPNLIDFAFMDAARRVIAQGQTTERLKQLFAADHLYKGGPAAARANPTFLGNHDKGRFAEALATANPDADEDELMARWRLGHALMLTVRGVPTIYAGDEQGFVGDPGGDQNAREDQFPSRTDVYNDNDLLGTDATTAGENFDQDHPFYRFIAEMAAIRQAEPALRRGRHEHRLADDDFGASLEAIRDFGEAPGPAGLYAFSRIDEETGTEILFAMNVSDAPRDVAVTVEPGSDRWSSLRGDCPAAATASSSYAVTVPAFGFVLCKAG